MWKASSCYLHVKALLKPLVHMILWFDYKVMYAINVVMFYYVIIFDATNVEMIKIY